MKKVKHFVVGVLVGGMLFSASTALANNFEQMTVLVRHMNYVVNGQHVEISGKTLDKDGVTYIPLREVATLLGYGVHYDKSTSTASFTSQDNASQKQIADSAKTNVSGGDSELVENLIESHLDDGKISLDKIKYSVDNGIISVNAQDEDTGETLLMRAVKENAYFVVMYLHEKGVNPDIQDFEGRTALHYAVIYDVGNTFSELIDTLEASGKIEDNYGKRPIDYTEGRTGKYLTLLTYKR